MTSLIYNPVTKALLDTIARDLPHALLLVGDEGVGLGTIARAVAWHDLAGVVESTTPDGVVDKTSKGVIRIGQIRELTTQTRSIAKKREVYVIDEADKMNLAAQNAFLKLLEEPTPNVSFILTAHAPHLLTATVLSRVQTVRIQQISREQSEQLIAKAGINDARKVQQLLFLGSGRPSLLHKLINDETYFSQKASVIADAREYVGGTPYQRAMIVQRYAADRSASLSLIEQSINLVQFSVSNSASPQLIALLDTLTTIYDRIAANGNVRLQLTTFVV